MTQEQTTPDYDNDEQAYDEAKEILAEYILCGPSNLSNHVNETAYIQAHEIMSMSAHDRDDYIARAQQWRNEQDDKLERDATNYATLSERLSSGPNVTS